MKSILQITLCLVLTNAAFAQRVGMGVGGGGGRPPVGGMGRGGIGTGDPHHTRPENFFERGTTRGFYYTNGFGYTDGYGSRGYGYGYASPYLGYGSWGLGYTSPGYYSNPANNASPNVTVIYPPAAESAPVPIYVERPVPVRHEYDATGQEIRQGAGVAVAANENASPVYLIAFKDHVIRAALSYRVEGGGLHYVTVDREQKRAALDSIDRSFTLQLNRERRVPIQLPE